MKNRLFAILTLAILLTITATSHAQGTSTQDDSGGFPIPLPVLAVGAVILALILRRALRIGSRPVMDDDYDEYEDEIIEKKRGGRRKGQHIDDDAEAYLIERDQMWDEDGYAGEEDVGF